MSLPRPGGSMRDQASKASHSSRACASSVPPGSNHGASNAPRTVTTAPTEHACWRPAEHAVVTACVKLAWRCAGTCAASTNAAVVQCPTACFAAAGIGARAWRANNVSVNAEATTEPNIATPNVPSISHGIAQPPEIAARAIWLMVHGFVALDRDGTVVAANPERACDQPLAAGLHLPITQYHARRENI